MVDEKRPPVHERRARKEKERREKIRDAFRDPREAAADAEETKESTAAMQDYVEALAEVLKQTRLVASEDANRARALGEIVTKSQELEVVNRANYDIFREIAEYEGMAMEARQEHVKQQIAALEIQKTREGENRDMIQARINALAKLATAGDEEAASFIANAKARRKASEEALDSFEAQRKVQSGFATGLGEVARLMGFQAKATDEQTFSFIKNTVAIIGNRTEGVGLMTMLGNLAMENLNLTNVLANLGAAMKEMVVTLDVTTSAFAAATGAGRQYKDQMVGVAKASTGAGVTLEAVGKATAGLRTEFVGFIDESKTTQDNLVTTSIYLDRLGADSELTGKNLTFLTKSLGLTSTDAVKKLEALSVAGMKVGVPVSEVNQQIQNLSKHFAAFGPRAIKVFEDTMIKARKLGVEMDQLVSVSEGFLEFDKAAESVAGLNAVLGTDAINTMDLMMAATEGPTAVIDKLRDAMESSGKTAADFAGPEGFMMLHAVSGIVGQDVDFVRRALLGQEGELKNNVTAMDSLKAMAEASVPMLELLREAFESIGLMANFVIEPLRDFVGWFNDTMNNMPVVAGAIGALAVVLGVKFFMGMRAASAAAADAAANLANAAAQVPALVTGINNLTTAMTRETTAANQATNAVRQHAQATQQAGQAAQQAATGGRPGMMAAGGKGAMIGGGMMAAVGAIQMMRTSSEDAEPAIGSMTMSLAGMGMIFGPWGAAIGAAIGLVLDLVNAFTKGADSADNFAASMQQEMEANIATGATGMKTAQFGVDEHVGRSIQTHPGEGIVQTPRGAKTTVLTNKNITRINEISKRVASAATNRATGGGVSDSAVDKLVGALSGVQAGAGGEPPVFNINLTAEIDKKRLMTIINEENDRKLRAT